MSASLKKLTKSQVRELQNMVQNILDNLHNNSSSIFATADGLQEAGSNAEIGRLMFQLEDRTTLLTQLSTITLTILTQLSTAIEQSSQLTQQLHTLKQQSLTSELEACQLRGRLDELVGWNRELRGEVEGVRAEKDVLGFRVELLVDGYEKEKGELMREVERLTRQVQKLSTTKLKQQQKLATLHTEIEHLHSNNEQLHLELQSMKQILHETTSKLSHHECHPVHEIECHGQGQAQKVAYHKEKQEPDTSIRDSQIRCGSSSLKIQLKEGMGNGIHQWDLGTSRYRERERQREEKNEEKDQLYKCLNTEQKSEMDTNKDKYEYDSYSYIDEESKQDLHEKIPDRLEEKETKGKPKLDQVKYSGFYPMAQSKQASKQPEKEIERNMKKDKKTFGSRMVKPEGMSRIKFLLTAIGGDNNYKHSKVQKFKVDKKKETQAAKRLAIKKMVSSPTTHTLSPIPSLSCLRASTNA